MKNKKLWIIFILSLFILLVLFLIICIVIVNKDIKNIDRFLYNNNYTEAEKIIKKYKGKWENKNILIAECKVYGNKNYANYSINREDDLKIIETALRTLETKYPDNLTVYDYKDMGFCSDVLKDHNRTLKYLNLALKLEPKNSELNSLIGLTYDSLNNSEEAQKYYTIAYKLDNTNLLSSWYYVGRVLYQKMDDSQVRQEMNNIMNKMLKNDEINRNKEIKELIYDTKNKICIINAQNSNNENGFLSNYCIKDLEMFIKSNNIKYSLIYDDLALSLISLNINLNDLLFNIAKPSKELTKLDIAMDYLDKAQTIDPGDFMAYFLKGIILEYKKDYNNAAEHYWQAYKTIKNFTLIRGYDLNFYQTAILLHILRVDIVNNNVSETSSVEKLINERGNTRLDQIKLQLKDIYSRNESEDLYKIISAINW